MIVFFCMCGRPSHTLFIILGSITALTLMNPFIGTVRDLEGRNRGWREQTVSKCILLILAMNGMNGSCFNSYCHSSDKDSLEAISLNLSFLIDRMPVIVILVKALTLDIPWRCGYVPLLFI